MSTSLTHLLTLAGLSSSLAENVTISGGDPILATRYRIAVPGAAVIAANGLAASELWALRTGRRQNISVDARAATASLRSNHYLRIDGRPPVRPRDKLTGFYRVRSGRWVYLQCNFANLRDRNIGVLGASPDRDAVAAAAANWDGPELEEAIFAAGGCGSFVRSESEWNDLPQAEAVGNLPLLEIVRIGSAPPQPLYSGNRPLSGIRVLDLTRVLAGPTCARTLAEHGAEVLKISCEGLPDSGSSDLDTGLGKLSAYLDLREPAGLQTMRQLISEADVFSQSYRPGALAARGLSPEELAKLRPGIIYITLSAWGHLGPWRDRRGYDSVVQGANGMAFTDLDTPPASMPVSAQDYVSGYLMSYGAMVALMRRSTEGGSWLVRVSLAGTGSWIRQHGLLAPSVYNSAPRDLPPEQINEHMMQSDSPLGHLTHLAPIVHMSETPPHWERPAVPLGYDPPVWPTGT